MTQEFSNLPRRLGGWSLAAITVGIVIGSGIFRSPSEIAGLVGTPGNVLIVWLIGGLVTMCLALSLAELAAMFPRSGGLYSYLQEAFGDRAAFLFGWTFFLINPANWAAVALIFADYITAVSPHSGSDSKWIATGAILLVSLVNIVSIRLSSQFNWVFTVVKGLALLGLSAGILLLSQGISLPGVDPEFRPTVGGWGAALIAVLWPFEGVAAAAALAGEVKNPRRNLPLGLIGGTLFVMLTYLLVNAAFLSALSVPAIAASPFVAADAARAVMGDWGSSIIAIAAIVATFGALLAGATCDPRVLFAMAEDRLFFTKVGAIHRRFQTPHIAIRVTALLAVAYVWVRTFEELAAQFVLGMWVFYGWCVIGLIKLRRTRPDLPRPYKVPWYPFLPVIFVLASGALLANAFVEMPVTSLANLVVILLGLPIYWLWTSARREQNLAVTDSAGG